MESSCEFVPDNSSRVNTDAPHEDSISWLSTSPSELPSTSSPTDPSAHAPVSPCTSLPGTSPNGATRETPFESSGSPNNYPPSNTRPALLDVFAEAHEQIENAPAICGLIKPYVLRALERSPTSQLLHEISAFLDEGIASCNPKDKMLQGGDTAWSCTNAELHSIVHILNGKELLIEDGVESETNAKDRAIQEEESDLAFLRDLEKFS
jgi:hypothetical protein